MLTLVTFLYYVRSLTEREREQKHSSDGMITAANKFIFDAVAIAIDDDEEESSSIVATEIPQINANLLFIFLSFT